MKNILVTGGAGFIGSNLIKRLFKDVKGATIVNIDNMNAYYDVSLKDYRLKELDAMVPEGINYKFVKGSIADKALVDKLFADYKFDVVVNLAAQAGVRYSIENPDVYTESNIIGFYNILEACRHNPVEHWYMPVHLVCTAATRRCRLRWRTGWTTPFRSMQPPRRATSCLPIATRSFTTSPAPV